MKEAGGQKSFESFKVKGFRENCLTATRESLREKDFKGVKDKGFEGFGEKDFEENCFGVKKKSLKEEVFRSLKEEGFVLSLENGMKCGVCGIDEDLEGEADLSGGVARGAPPERLEGTGFPGGLAGKAPSGRPGERLFLVGWLARHHRDV